MCTCCLCLAVRGDEGAGAGEPESTTTAGMLPAAAPLQVERLPESSVAVGDGDRGWLAGLKRALDRWLQDRR